MNNRLKKSIAVILVLIMLCFSFEVRASEIVADGIGDLMLASQHYYNTKVAYDDLYVRKTSDDEYCIYRYDTQAGKTLLLRLYKTAWGTWNLGNWELSGKYGYQTIIGGATDWEYVLRVLNPVSQNMEYVGGNHGSEMLNSFFMYDDVSGQPIEFSDGQMKYANRIVIEENTTLHMPNYDYLKWANVNRVYTITGETITLDCRVEFIRDVRMARSYTAMACVSKDFGRYCSFDNKAFVRTDPKGSFSNERLGNVEAMVCTLSGDDPTLTVTVSIYNRGDMTDGFSNNDKTFLWDMTNSFSKLYFSKYNATDSKIVKNGTVWNFSTSWAINFQ